MTRLKLEPNNPEAHFNLAVAYEEAGSYDDAMQEYEKTLSLNPTYARAMMHIGFIQIKKKEPDKAIELWEEAFGIDPNLVSLFRTPPTAAYYKGKIDDVCAFFQRKVQEAPKNAKAHYELGLVYSHFNKLELALQCFRTATELNGVMWEAYLKCGETYARLGQTRMAIDQLKYGIVANPSNKNPVIHLSLADVYMSENMMGYAQQQLDKALALDPNSVKAYIMLGRLFFRLSNFKMAMKNYQHALSIDPQNAEAHYQLAKTCEAMYRPDFALIELEKAVANRQDYAEAYYDWGNLLLQMGDAEKAIPKLEYVLKINPNDAYAHYTLGTAYLKIEDYHAALHHFKASTQINQSDAYTYYNLGICCVKTKDTNGALNAFLKAMELSPNDASYCYQRYLVNMSQMNFDEAKKDIKRAIKANPAEIDYRLKLVSLYKRDKDYKSILDELNDYININPKIASVYSEMGIAYSALGEAAIAKVSFEKALGLDPNDVRAIYGKGSLLKESGVKIREAKEMFRKALEIDPYFLPALEDLGLMCFEEGDAAKGAEYYKTAIDHASPEEFNGVKVNYAKVLIKTGHAQEGISVFDSLIQDRPEDARLRLSLAKAYEAIEKYDDAINQLHIAQELEPENPDYPMALGSIFMELGLIDEARDTYYTIINMYPSHREAQDALSRLLSQSAGAPAVPPSAPDLSYKRQQPKMDIPALDLRMSEKPGAMPGGDMLPTLDLDFSEFAEDEPAAAEPVISSSKSKPQSRAEDDDPFKSASLGFEKPEVSSQIAGIFSDFSDEEEEPEQPGEYNEEPSRPEPVPASEFEPEAMDIDFGKEPDDPDEEETEARAEEPAPAEAPAGASEPDKEEDDDLLNGIDFDDLEAPAEEMLPSLDDDQKSPAEDMMPGFELPTIDAIDEPSTELGEFPDLDLGLDLEEDGGSPEPATPAARSKKLKISDEMADFKSSSNPIDDKNMGKSLSQEDIFGASGDDIFKSESSIFGDDKKPSEEPKAESKTALKGLSDDIFGIDDDIFGDSIPEKPAKDRSKKSADEMFSSSSFLLDEPEVKKSPEKPKKEEKPAAAAKAPEKPRKEEKPSALFSPGSELDDLFDLSNVPEASDDDDDIFDVGALDDGNEAETESGADGDNGDLEKEMGQLEKVLSAQPTNKDTRILLIDVCMKLGHYDKAYENEKELISQTDPDYKDYARIVEIYDKAGKADELKRISEDYMSQAEIKDEFIPEICERLRDAGKRDIAIAECRKAAKANSNNTGLALLLGKLYTEAGNPALATLQYQKAIRKSQDPSINILLADAYEKMNNIKGAIKTLKKYLESVPGDAEIQAKYDRLVAAESEG